MEKKSYDPKFYDLIRNPNCILGLLSKHFSRKLGALSPFPFFPIEKKKKGLSQNTPKFFLVDESFLHISWKVINTRHLKHQIRYPIPKHLCIPKESQNLQWYRRKFAILTYL